MSSSPPVSLSTRSAESHKGDFGRVLMVGGSRGMAGSIGMSSIAALRTGSGLVSCAVPDRCLETVAALHPCVMTIAVPDDSQGRFSLDASSSLAKLTNSDNSFAAIGCGPGMTTDPGSLRIIDRITGWTAGATVLDADALNGLALHWKNTPAPDSSLEGKVLTPHPGELSRLTGVPASDRQQQIEAAQELSQRTGAVIVVKGGPSVVVYAQQRWTNSTGNPGMATAGSGDVLTGVITSLCGQKMSAWDAARLGVWVHGRAGDLAASHHGQAGMTALEIIDFLPQAMTEVAT